MDDWRALAEKELGGRPLQTLRHATDDGLMVQPLYQASDAPWAVHSAAPRSAWSICHELRQGAPAAAAAAAAQALARGASALQIWLDRPARHGVEPGTQGQSAGSDGVALHRGADLGVILREVDLASTALHLETGASSLAVLAFLLLEAERRGVVSARLHGSLGHDPLQALCTREGLAAPSLQHALSHSAALLAFTAEHCPRLRAVTVHGAPFHDAGASPSQELAATLACGIAYLRACRLPERACAGIAFSLDVAHDLLIELAKLRAARLLWRTITQAFGSSAPMFLIGRTSTFAGAARHDHHTNLLRRALQAFVAAAGGCDAVVVVPADPDPDHQDDAAARLAGNQQLLLQHEALLGLHPGALDGSFALEALTDELARAAWTLLQRIEAEGGIVASLRCGTLQDAIAQHAVARSRRIATRREVQVGLNRYVDPLLEGARTKARRRIELHREVLAALANDRAARDAPGARQSLDALREAALQEPGDLVPCALQAARHGAILAEMASATATEERTTAGWRLAARSSALDFEELREAADEQEEHFGRRPTVLVAVDAGGDAVARTAREVLQSGGIALEEALELDPPALAERAQHRGAAAIVLCSSDGPARAARAHALAKLLAPRQPRPLLLVATPPAPEPDEPHDGRIGEGIDAVELLRRIESHAVRCLP